MTTIESLYTDESVEKRKNQEDPIILYMVVRKSLNMSIGKTAAQCSHGSMMATLKYFHLLNDINTKQSEFALIDIFGEWLHNSFRKVVLGADENHWLKLEKYYEDKPGQLITVTDAGLTEIPAQTDTVRVIWPMRKSEAPQVIKKLQALK